MSPMPILRRNTGSSPRLRGTLADLPHAVTDRGIIPALAGNTETAGPFSNTFGDHPRACGEHVDIVSQGDSNMGSSPRLRGTPARRPTMRARPGIIPALAGNTIVSVARGNRTRDHPRACGEHARHWQQPPLDEGPSPRLRGTLHHIVLEGCTIGIIPALAGNTLFLATHFRAVWDHPRACGEHNYRIIPINPEQGSSPRLRGTPDLGQSATMHAGIIPALAGNTVMLGMSSMTAWDHPRACGEHFALVSLMLSRLGSSPRLRGTHLVDAGLHGRVGIIPALAGNTVYT